MERSYVIVEHHRPLRLLNPQSCDSNVTPASDPIRAPTVCPTPILPRANSASSSGFRPRYSITAPNMFMYSIPLSQPMANMTPNTKYEFDVRRSAVLRMAAMEQTTNNAKMSLGLLVRNKRAVEQAMRFPSWNARPYAAINDGYRGKIGIMLVARGVPEETRLCAAVTRIRGFIHNRRTLLSMSRMLRRRRSRKVMYEGGASDGRSESFWLSISDTNSSSVAEVFDLRYGIGGRTRK